MKHIQIKANKKNERRENRKIDRGKANKEVEKQTEKSRHR